MPRYEDPAMLEKIDISLPVELLSAVDALASRLGLSRSELFAAAVAEYVAEHNASEVTSRLDDVYARESSDLDPVLRDAQSRAIEL
jgi:metal-responsive CopG/Arc/MetJ family transcriptional regulator